MNADQLHDAFGELPEDLVASVAGIRGRKKVMWAPWVAAAACACLVLALGWRFVPVFSADNAAPEIGKFNGLLDSMEAAAHSEADHAPQEAETVLLVQVEKIEEGGILVRVLADQHVAEGTQIRIPVNMQQETYAVGDCLKVYCDGQLLETWPLQLGRVFGIERVETP